MPTATHTLARGALAAALLTPLAPLAAAAQGPEIEPVRLGPATRDGEPRFMGGATFSIGQPRGEFHKYVADGYGVGLHGLARVGSYGAFALRLDGGFLIYGSEKKRVPLSETVGGRVRVDLTTRNNIFWLGAGPQLMAPRGPVRPYVNGTVGFSYFATTSSVQGRDDEAPFAQDTNYDDAQLSWGAGGGVLLPVYRNERTMVFVDLGARYHDNGRRVRYLRAGGIRDLPGGNIELDVIESRADLVTWHLGVSIGGR
jgi:hypothetical protein